MNEYAALGKHFLLSGSPYSHPKGRTAIRGTGGAQGTLGEKGGDGEGRGQRHSRAPVTRTEGISLGRCQSGANGGDFPVTEPALAKAEWVAVVRTQGYSWGGKSCLGWKWAPMTPGSLSSPFTVCVQMWTASLPHWDGLKTTLVPGCRDTWAVWWEGQSFVWAPPPGTAGEVAALGKAHARGSAGRVLFAVRPMHGPCCLQHVGPAQPPGRHRDISEGPARNPCWTLRPSHL